MYKIQTTHRELDSIARMVSLEAAVSPFTMMSEPTKYHFDKFLDTFALGIKSQITRLSASLSISRPSKMEKTLKAFTDKISYVDAIDILLPCPEGFGGNLLAYGTAVLDVVTAYEMFSEEVLTVVQNQLEFILAKGEKLTTISFDEMNRGLRINDTYRDNFKQTLATFFDGKSNHTTTKLGNLVENYTQLTNAVLTIDEVSEKLDKYNTKEVVSKVKDINAIAGRIHVRLKNGELSACSNKIAQYCTKVLGELSAELEFYEGVLNIGEELAGLNPKIIKMLEKTM